MNSLSRINTHTHTHNISLWYVAARGPKSKLFSDARESVPGIHGAWSLRLAQIRRSEGNRPVISPRLSFLLLFACSLLCKPLTSTFSPPVLAFPDFASRPCPYQRALRFSHRTASLCPGVPRVQANKLYLQTPLENECCGAISVLLEFDFFFLVATLFADLQRWSLLGAKSIYDASARDGALTSLSPVAGLSVSARACPPTKAGPLETDRRCGKVDTP